MRHVFCLGVVPSWVGELLQGVHVCVCVCMVINQTLCHQAQSSTAPLVQSERSPCAHWVNISGVVGTCLTAAAQIRVRHLWLCQQPTESVV